MKTRGNKLFVVIPCYNEEAVLHETTKRLKEKLETLIKNKVISKDSKVMYVNDGSKDKTWELIKEISEKEKLFTGITLSRNRGHQNALVGGLLTAKNYADVVISMIINNINTHHTHELVESFSSESFEECICFTSRSYTIYNVTSFIIFF